jgi:hypothetical protein
MKISIIPLLITSSILAQENYKIPYQELREASISYIESNCDKDKIKELNDKLDKRIAQKLVDNPNLQEDGAMRTIVFDWVADNKEYLRKRDKTTVTQACLYFIRFVDKKYPLPSQFCQQLDEKACNEIINYMKEQSADAKNVSSIEPNKK